MVAAMLESYEEDDDEDGANEDSSLEEAIDQANRNANALRFYLDSGRDLQISKHERSAAIRVFLKDLNANIRDIYNGDAEQRALLASTLLEHYDLIGEISEQGKILNIQIDPDDAGPSPGQVKVSPSESLRSTKLGR